MVIESWLVESGPSCCGCSTWIHQVAKDRESLLKEVERLVKSLALTIGTFHQLFAIHFTILRFGEELRVIRSNEEILSDFTPFLKLAFLDKHECT